MTTECNLKNIIYTLKQRLRAIDVSLYGNCTVLFSDIVYDSRRVKPGVLFFALPNLQTGLYTGGNSFITDAIKNGASAIVTCASYESVQKEIDGISSGTSSDTAKVGIACVTTSDIRRIMAECSSIFFGNPAKELKIIGVTGTDGKSTTVKFIHQLLTHQKIRAGFWSTVQFFDGLTFSGNDFKQSTPESPDLHRAMRYMCNNKCTHAVLEITSHALSNKTLRVYAIQFDVAVLTNIDSEHLEFHGTHKQYVKDKSNLFAQVTNTCDREGTGIMKKEEPYTKLFKKALHSNNKRSSLYTYSIHSDDATLTVKNIKEQTNKSSGKLYFKNKYISDVQLNCAGVYNLENALAALLATWAVIQPKTDNTLCQIVNNIKTLTPPTGRMYFIKHKGVTCIVDYAHTPGSFKVILPMFKNILQKTNKKGKLIVVFGSAGDRDVHKRAVQGCIADKYADIIILTDEDPRSENAHAILEDITSGFAKTNSTKNGNKKKLRIMGKNLYLIEDRKTAIQKACGLAKKNDIVVCLGKGHEKTIEYKDYTMPWDEIKTAHNALKKL